MNVADIVEQNAQRSPDAPALLTAGGWRLGYAEAAEAVRGIASILAGQGIAASDLVGVSIRGREELLLLSMLALARLGAVSVPILPAASRGKRKAIAEHFKLAAIVTDRDELGAGSARLILADTSWLQLRAPQKAPPSHAGGEHPWCINLTSGTTGTPKGVPRTHAGFFRLSALQRPLARLEPGSRFLCFMDLHNAPVISRAMNHLAAEGAVVFQGSARRGSRLPIEEHGVTHAFASPIMMQFWLKARPPGRPPYGSLKQLVVGGGALSAELGREIAERITPNLYVNYGSTETGVVAVADARLRAQHPDTAGRLVPWVEAQAVDESDRPLPAGESGVLRFRGEGVASSYYAAASEASARAKAFHEGWFYPGDVGRISDEGLLFIEARTDDVVNVGGPKFNATVIEAALARHPSVREAAVFSLVTPEGKVRLVAAVAAREPLDKAALVRWYRDRGGSLSSLLRIVQFARLPRNAMGKVLKEELKRRIRFKPAAPP